MAKKSVIDLPTRKVNRLLGKAPKPGQFWCWYCDRDIVGDGGKCNTCGKQNGNRKFKRRDIP